MDREEPGDFWRATCLKLYFKLKFSHSLLRDLFPYQFFSQKDIKFYSFKSF